MTDWDKLYANSSNLDRAQRVLSDGKEFYYNQPLNKNLSPGLGIVVLTKNRPEFILPLLEQLKQAKHDLENSGIYLQVVIGDTGTSDQEVLNVYDSLAPKDILVVRDLEYHFSKNNNVLAKRITKDHVLFLNNDIHFKDATQSLKALYNYLSEMCRGPFDIAGAQLAFPVGTSQHTGVYFSRHINQWALPYHLGAGEELTTLNAPIKVPAVTGAFLALKIDSFLKLGGFPEFYSAECQDIDLCLKARRLGGVNTVLNLGHIIHFENGTRTKGETHSLDRSQFLRRWRGFIEEQYLYSGPQIEGKR